MRRVRSGVAGAQCTANSRCHFAAFFGATLTCLCAVLTMLRLVFCTFVAAGLTNFGADAAGTCGKLRTARHQAHCGRAYRGAGTIQLDASRHHFYILLMQAFRCAMFAGNYAVVTCVNTALIFFVRHTQLINRARVHLGLERQPDFLCATAETTMIR